MSEACRAGLLSWDNEELWIWNQNYGIQLLSAAGKASHVISPILNPSTGVFLFLHFGVPCNTLNLMSSVHIPRKGAKASSSSEKSQMPVYCLPHSWTSVTFCYFLLLSWCNLFLSSSFPKPRLSSLSSLSISFLVCSPFIILFYYSDLIRESQHFSTKFFHYFM